jgi:hypothetical protein
MQRLNIRVHGYELDAADFGRDHSIDGRAAGAAYANDFYLGKGFNVWFDFSHIFEYIDGSFLPLLTRKMFFTR